MFIPDTLEKQIEQFHKAKSSWVWDIYVPSYNRAGKAPFLEMMKTAPGSIKKKIHVGVRKEQYEEYKTTYPDYNIFLVKGTTVGDARVSCLEKARASGATRICMIDDDIVHVHPLRTVTLPSGKIHSQRYSETWSKIPEPMQTCRALAVSCKISGNLMDKDSLVSYGALRNDLFSGDVNTSHAAFINRGPFPSCLFFIDLERFTLNKFPKPYRRYGEDLVMFLHNQVEGKKAFVIQNVAYDQHYVIPSTIDFDANVGVGRKSNIDAAAKHYPAMYPYLRTTMKNSDGGVKRIGFYWHRIYKDYDIEPQIILVDEVL